MTNSNQLYIVQKVGNRSHHSVTFYDKAASANNVFILYSTAPCEELNLLPMPDMSGIVHKGNWKKN